MVKLLVIDDELVICDVLKDYFSHKHYKVFIATSGEEGLSIVREKRPHIILLDILIPGCSGIDILKRIKEIDNKAKVVMLSVIENRTMIKQAKKYGASDYIIKPFSLESLEKEVMPEILKQLI